MRRVARAWIVRERGRRTRAIADFGGHFVGFLVDSWGMDAAKRIYAAADLQQALLDETGSDLAGVEAAWLASIP